jgi:hypothetical protein
MSRALSGYCTLRDDLGVPINTHQLKSQVWPAWVLLPVVVGYITMTRGFAHIGISPLYIGEATLGLLLVAWPGTILGTWARTQLRQHTYTTLATLSVIFVAYGLFQCLRGLIGSGFPKSSLQNFAFNYYIAFLFAGMWLGERHRNLLSRLIWWLAWINAIYGIAYLLVLGRPVTSEDTSAPIFGWPAGSAIAILGLLCFERDTKRILLPLALNVFVLLGRQVRAEWLAIACAIVLFSVLRGQFIRLMQLGAVVGGLVLAGVLADVKIPAPSSFGGVISARDIVGRAISAVDERAAARLTEHASAFAGSVSWRTEWWNNLLELTHKRTHTVLFGLGYGYPIWELNPHVDEVNPTPHNIFIYVLTYTGWVGVAIFYTLQLYLAWLLWKSYLASGQPFGICLWMLMFVWAHFDNRLETPYGAIPFWVLVGMALTSFPLDAVARNRNALKLPVVSPTT